ncbi:MAG: hypothetical protein Q8O67_29240 [Deltaproteobacteria bacterium]|nr:hypothetical protein [Deltaproteobacteria bacterium]
MAVAPAANAQVPVAAPPPAATVTETPAAVDASVVPTYMDTVQRGLRFRFDLGGRYGAAGLPDPPVRLDVDDAVLDRTDLDVAGTVIFGYDRPGGVPIAADVFGDFGGDIGGDSPVSPYLDDQSVAPRVRLYSAFIGLSANAKEPGLQPFKVNLGRMTEIVESPITYDGLSLGAQLKFTGVGHLNAKLWGGVDAPQRLAGDPFSRTSNRAYSEVYAQDPEFFLNPGAFITTRTAIVDPILNPVGGLAVDGRFSGFGFILNHTFMPSQSLWIDDANNANDLILPLQRTTLGFSYRYDSDFVLADVAIDTKATDFLPRNVSLRGDALTGDGTTRVGLVTRLQFLEDITAYDGTFRAFNPLNVFDQAVADGQEQLRVRDQIRHLNFGPPQEHIYLSGDIERQLPASFQASLRARLRQHFDVADVDAFRSNFYEAGAGVSWNPGFAFDVGTELVGGFVDSGVQNGLAYDLIAEGIVSYVEPRVWVRSTLLEGKLSNLSEVFVRRQDIQTKGLTGNGQWGGALATTTRYDVLDWWTVSLRLDADALTPIDSLNATYYLGALVGTSVRF